MAILQTALGIKQFWPDWVDALPKERAIGNDEIAWMRRNPTLMPHMLSALESRPEYPWAVSLLHRGIPRGWFYLEQVRYNLLFHRAVLAPMDQASGYADPDVIRAATAELNRVLTRNVDAGADTQPRVIHVCTDLAKTACALERHRLAQGEFPETLADLVPTFLKEVPRDLIRSQPLVYRRLENQSFLLYSIGWNGVDNGGQPATEPDTSPEVSSGDWVWPSTAMEE